jgi:NifU-like protein involved in Fe-S cluster formation
LDEQVIKYYRKLLRSGFEYTGTLENPSIFLDSVGEKIRICSHIEQNYLHIYINISEDTVKEIKYLCMCDPTANVAVEVLCSLVKGKMIKELETLTKESFSLTLGSSGEDYLKSARGLIELLHRGIARYKGYGHQFP